MSQIITATFQDGAFVPDEPINVAAGARVRLTVEPAAGAAVSEPTPGTLRDHKRLPEEAMQGFVERAEQVKLRSGLRMTRDELHERD